MGKTAVDEMQRAVDLYQMELAKLQAVVAAKTAEQEKDQDSGPAAGAAAGGSGSGASSAAGDEPKAAKLSPASSPFPGGLPLPAGFPVPPPLDDKLSSASSTSSSPAFPPTSASPLQGMASITNSLTAQPLHAPYRPPQRSYKAVLPPITQEQFDRYEHINTEELVRKVRVSQAEEKAGQVFSPTGVED